MRDVLDALAALGMPVVGDRLAGGVLVDDDAPGSPGGAALARGGAHRAQWRRAAIGADGSVARVPAIAPALARAAAGLGAPASERGAPPVPLRISHAAARALARGHPWVLRDPGCDDALAHRPGALVELRDRERGDRAIALALADGDGTCVARCLPRGAAGASIEQRVDAAIARRGALAFPPARATAAARTDRGTRTSPATRRAPGGGRDATDAVRLVHGEADALPGLAIDRLGPALRALVVGRAGLGIARVALARAAERLEAELGCACVAIEVVHVRAPAAARGAALVQASVVRGDAAWLARDGEGRFEVRERGLAFGVEPGLADPTRAMPGVGLFLDQRDNRERLARFARATGGGRWLNLFAHTGAFSVALLAAGAAEVTSVDLSARYLRWLDDNLARNRARGVDARRHVAARRDGRRFLEVLGARERFRGIVLDPPTAAAAGRKHWSIRKDLQPLVEKALEHLEPGGRLLVCRNDRARRGPSLGDACEAAARAAGVRLARLDAAPPGPDFPSLPGFPEGDPFRGVLLERAP
ncbi:MAG: class I SAM-dependent methyltransferase [Myxococcota bacterium]